MLVRTTTGMELSGRDLRIVVLRTVLGRRRLLRTLVIEDFLELDETERRARLHETVSRYKIPVFRTHLVLPADYGVTRQLELPAGVANKAESIVELQLESLSPWPPGEVYWSVGVPASGTGKANVWVTVSVIPKETAVTWLDFFKSAGVPLRGLSVAPAAWAHGASSMWDRNVPRIVLGFRPDRVDGVLVNGAQFHSASAEGTDPESAAGNVVDRLVALGRVSKAGELRIVTSGDVPPAWQEGSDQVLPIEGAGSRAAAHFGAVAASLLESVRGPFKSNLLPDDLRYRHSRVRLVPTYALGVCLLAALAASAGREGYQNLVYADRLDSAIERIRPGVDAILEQEVALAEARSRYESLRTLVSSGDRNLEALETLARTMPPETWLLDYSYQDGTITIAGFSSSTSDLQRLLEAEPMFGQVQLVSPITRDASGKDRFNIRISLEAQR